MADSVATSNAEKEVLNSTQHLVVNLGVVVEVQDHKNSTYEINAVPFDVSFSVVYDLELPNCIWSEIDYPKHFFLGIAVLAVTLVLDGR